MGTRAPGRTWPALVGSRVGAGLLLTLPHQKEHHRPSRSRRAAGSEGGPGNEALEVLGSSSCVRDAAGSRALELPNHKFLMRIETNKQPLELWPHEMELERPGAVGYSGKLLPMAPPARAPLCVWAPRGRAAIQLRLNCRSVSAPREKGDGEAGSLGAEWAVSKVWILLRTFVRPFCTHYGSTWLRFAPGCGCPMMRGRPAPQTPATSKLPLPSVTRHVLHTPRHGYTA